MEMREQVNKRVDGKWGAVVVACAGLAAVTVFVASVDLGQFEWSWIAALVIGLFAVALLGFTVLAYGERGRVVTSEETDKNALEAWVSFRNAVRWPVFVGFLLILSYLVWQVHLELRWP